MPEFINRCCLVDDLADLTTPTHVVTTDLVDGSPTWWTAGPARDILLAFDRVMYVGQPVVAVLAETEGAAQDAAELVSVEYDPP